LHEEIIKDASIRSVELRLELSDSEITAGTPAVLKIVGERRSELEISGLMNNVRFEGGLKIGGLLRIVNCVEGSYVGRNYNAPVKDEKNIDEPIVVHTKGGKNKGGRGAVSKADEPN